MFRRPGRCRWLRNLGGSRDLGPGRRAVRIAPLIRVLRSGPRRVKPHSGDDLAPACVIEHGLGDPQVQLAIERIDQGRYVFAI